MALRIPAAMPECQGKEQNFEYSKYDKKDFKQNIVCSCHISDGIYDSTCYLSVVMRYVFVHPVTWSEDTLTYSFVWMSLIGTAVVFGERDHMMLTLFSDKLEGIPKQILCIISEIVIMVLVYVLMVKGGMSVFNIGKGQVSPTLGIRMSNVYTILPVSGVFILIYNVLNIIDSVAAIVNNKKGGAA